MDIDKDISLYKAHRKRHEKSPINTAMREFIDGLHDNRRLHLSKTKIKKLDVEYAPDAHEYKPATFSVEEKLPIPTGFWWGIDGSWADWCLAEQFRGGERYFYELEIDMSNMRVITDIPEFEAFEKEFIGHPPWADPDLIPTWTLTMPRMPREIEFSMGYIDWPKVAERYAGVEIAPYLWQKRLSAHWYYGWDCASGVLWDINIVKEFRLYAAYSSKTQKFEVHDVS